MSLMDALFYWLQMKWVLDVFPEDEAAKETARFFAQILSEDHELTEFGIESVDSGKVHVAYAKRDGTSRTVWFDREAVGQLRRDMFGDRDEPEEKGGDDEEETH
ncbi:hypothetical protein ACFPPD_00265 [Cohnella suwonensis]|uniref:Uncharacterized protein n=1 Tax=Cohnella suwonensis TaxID=696072 RepID=A0ABW0LML4_9BACL